MHFAQLYCWRPCFLWINYFTNRPGRSWFNHNQLINMIHKFIRISPDFHFEVITGAVVVVRTYFKFGEGHVRKANLQIELLVRLPLATSLPAPMRQAAYNTCLDTLGSLV